MGGGVGHGIPSYGTCSSLFLPVVSLTKILIGIASLAEAFGRRRAALSPSEPAPALISPSEPAPATDAKEALTSMRASRPC